MKIMRFWTAPVRPQKCACGEDTEDLPNHIFRQCRKNRLKVERFISNMSPARKNDLGISVAEFIRRCMEDDRKFLEKLMVFISKLTF